jgi:hypothetical protein
MAETAGETGDGLVAGTRLPDKRVSNGGSAKDRNGLPVLDGKGSLGRLFAQAGESGREGGDGTPSFDALLEESLKGRDMDALLREKRERPLPGPVPLGKRLRRYPKPETQLDLHGFTAARAGTRTDAFVRSAWRAGTFTLRIIVGRGLHSEFGAVLPDVVEEILLDLKKQKIVLGFEWEKRKKSVSGAVIVYLNQFND